MGGGFILDIPLSGSNISGICNICDVLGSTETAGLNLGGQDNAVLEIDDRLDIGIQYHWPSASTESKDKNADHNRSATIRARTREQTLLVFLSSGRQNPSTNVQSVNFQYCIDCPVLQLRLTTTCHRYYMPQTVQLDPGGASKYPICYMSASYPQPQQFTYFQTLTYAVILNSSLLTKGSRMDKRIQYIKTNQMIKVNEILKKTIKRTTVLCSSNSS